MDDLTKQLAAGASAYLQELPDRDVPYEFAVQLVRDRHQAKLASYFGLAQTTVITPAPDPAETARAVRAELLKLQQRDLSAGLV
jgi:hypothetical protein